MNKKQVRIAANLWRLQANPDTQNVIEHWMEDLGSKFVVVWFRVGGAFLDERHVYDDLTFPDTVTMSLRRWSCRHAFWSDGDGDGFTCLDEVTGDTKRFPTREAVEMWVIHHGQ